jgi:hypothetical protein
MMIMFLAERHIQSRLEDLNAVFSDALAGPFNLSCYEPIVNFIAIMWIIVAIVFSTFPTVKTVTSNSTNLCIVFIMAWMFSSAVSYYLGKKGRLTGPILR